MFTYYQILEIEENANVEDIKKAYKRMAKKYHPDVSKHVNSEEYFKLIIIAYENLSDETQRLFYDTWLQQERSGKNKTTKVKLPKDYKPAYSSSSKIKEDNEVVKWAAVSVLGFIFIVLLSIVINDFLKEKKIKDQIAFEYSLLEKAKIAAKQNDNVTAFKILDSIAFDMQYLYTEHKKIYDSLHSNITITSLAYFKNKEYEKVHSLLDELKDSTHSVMTEKMLWQLALSQFNIGKYSSSAETYRELIQKNKWDYNAYMAFSEVYSSGLKQPNKAIAILTEGAILTTEEYTSNYGTAYAVILNGDDIPMTHFNIYFLRARLLLQQKRYEEVIRDLNWALRLRPKHKNAYYILGNTYSLIGDRLKACKAWSEAERFGHIRASIMLNKHCY